MAAAVSTGEVSSTTGRGSTFSGRSATVKGESLPLEEVSTCTLTSFTSTPEQEVTYCLICFCRAATARGMFTPPARPMRRRITRPSRVVSRAVDMT